MNRRFSWRGVRKALAWIGSVGVLVLLGLYLTGTFDDRIPSDAEVAARGRAPEGRTVLVRRVTMPVVERAPGTLRAVRDAVVASRLIAEVREVLVRAGTRVDEGEPMVLLDDRDLQALLEQTQQQLVGARARLEEAESAYVRTETAAEKGAASRSALDQAEAARSTARSEVARLEQRVEQATVDLSHATIRAPFDAVVIDRYAQAGDLASPDRPLLRVYDPTRMRLEVHVRETLAIGLEVGEEVQVRIDTLGARLAGEVEEVVPQAEAASRAFLVKVGLPQRDDLYPGMFGRLLLESGTIEQLVVPEESLTRVGQLVFVTLADGAGTRRLVVPGEPAGEGVVEIRSGVEEGLELLVPR